MEIRKSAIRGDFERKEQIKRQEKWELGALLCIGIAGIIIYAMIQIDLKSMQMTAEPQLIDGHVLPRNDAQMLNGY